MLTSLRASVRSVGARLGFSAPPPVPAGEVALAGPAQAEAGPTLEAVRAAGATLAEALAMVGQVHGRDMALALLKARLEGGGPTAVVALLNGVGAVDPGLAQAALERWGRDRHVDGDLRLNHCPWACALPEGLVVEGALDLEGLPIRSLPMGLKVGGNLWLTRSAIETLPDRLSVGGSLLLGDCAAWDGRIPRTGAVASALYTPAHPCGLLLPEWRRQHPEGERDD